MYKAISYSVRKECLVRISNSSPPPALCFKLRKLSMFYSTVKPDLIKPVSIDKIIWSPKKYRYSIYLSITDPLHYGYGFTDTLMIDNKLVKYNCIFSWRGSI